MRIAILNLDRITGLNRIKNGVEWFFLSIWAYPHRILHVTPPEKTSCLGSPVILLSRQKLK